MLVAPTRRHTDSIMEEQCAARLPVCLCKTARDTIYTMQEVHDEKACHVLTFCVGLKQFPKTQNHCRWANLQHHERSSEVHSCND
jgi:hypothetical protein